MTLDLKQKLMTLLAGAVVAAMVAFFVAPSYRQGEASLHGRAAQDFALTLNGKPMHLSDFRGHLVVLNFWASWCGPCVDEAPSLNSLQQRISALGGTIIGVDAGVNEDEASYEKFLTDYHISFPTYLDTSKQIAASYGTIMYPETYIINPDGTFDRKIIGPQDWTSPEMVSYIDSLIPKKQSSQETSLVP